LTLNTWLAAHAASDVENLFLELTDRKLHFLTAAFLRRVWDDLPSDHTRAAVEATEAFAAGRIAANELARMRTVDLLDSGEALWLGRMESWRVEHMLGGWGCCDYCDREASAYECRSVSKPGGLPEVREALGDPRALAAGAAVFARELATWKGGTEAERAEAEAQFALFEEIVGPRWLPPERHQWRTADAKALARAIDRTRNFGALPILADALQEAGCDNERVLAHCRASHAHVAGCWMVDMVLGYA
jgi:hypothetical protein